MIVSLPPKLSHAQKQFHQLSRLGIESFRFEEQNEYDYDIELKVFYSCSQKKTPQESFIVLFSPKTLSRLFTLKEVKPSPDSKMIKLLIFDNLFPPLRHSR